MQILYINDSHFSEKSGEIHHTAGFLNNITSPTIFYTARHNRDILQKKIKNDLVSIRYRTNIKLARVLKNCFSCLFADRLSVIYMRKSFYTWIYLFFLKMQTFIEVNGISSIESDGFIRFLNSLSDRFIFKSKKITGVIAVSTGIKQYIVDQFKCKNVHVIENGVASYFNIKTLPPKDPKRFVFVGGLAPWQDFQYLIKLIDKHRRYFEDGGLYVDIYGSGSEEGVIKRLIQDLDITHLIRLKGIVSNEKLPNEIANASVGLIIDKRFYKGKPLFSPLKLYEYHALNLVPAHITNLSVARTEQLANVKIENFQSWYENMALPISQPIRTWEKVIQEVLEVINA